MKRFSSSDGEVNIKQLLIWALRDSAFIVLALTLFSSVVLFGFVSVMNKYALSDELVKDMVVSFGAYIGFMFGVCYCAYFVFDIGVYIFKSIYRVGWSEFFKRLAAFFKYMRDGTKRKRERHTAVTPPARCEDCMVGCYKLGYTGDVCPPFDGDDNQ